MLQSHWPKGKETSVGDGISFVRGALGCQAALFDTYFFLFFLFFKIYFNRIILVWINNTWFNPCPIYFQFGKPIWFGNWKCKSSSLLRSQSKCLLSCWKRVLQRFIWVHGRSCHNGGCHCQHASDIVCIDAFVASF